MADAVGGLFKKKKGKKKANTLNTSVINTGIDDASEHKLSR